MPTAYLPEPPPEAAQHSAIVQQGVRSAIVAAGGWLDFAAYMELVLYAPGLGYYSAGASKFGASGDFITAPELTPLFAQAVAVQVGEVCGATAPHVLELGAGSGALADDLLGALAQIDALPHRYSILERSAELRARQQKRLQPWAGRIELRWLDAMPSSWHGVVLANEVFDALPVHLVQRRNGRIEEIGVGVQGEQLCLIERPAPDRLAALADAALPQVEGYRTELSLAAQGLLHSLAGMLQRGVVLIFDYGFPKAEYFHPQRAGGTLMCHYRHRAHADPLLFPGLQDITSHVEFSTLASIGREIGLGILGYTSQAQFLINCGLLDLLAQVDPTDTLRYVPQASAVQKLLSPAEMGELFKVLALGRACPDSLRGFAQGDRRAALD